MANFGKRRDAQQEEIELLTDGSVLRLAFVFGLLGLVMALALTPALNSGSIDLAAFTNDDPSNQIDRTVTGSISANAGEIKVPDGTKRYIIRRSVLQSDPIAPCYIFEDGSQQGGC